MPEKYLKPHTPPNTEILVHEKPRVNLDKLCGIFQVKRETPWFKRASDEMMDSFFSEKTLEKISVAEHYTARHTKQTDAQMINRVIGDKFDRKYATAAFTDIQSQDDLNEKIANFLMDHCEALTAFTHQSKSKKLVIEEIPKDHPVGEGIRYNNGRLEHVKCYAQTMVVEKDRFNPYNDRGFKIATFFPDAGREAVQDNKDLHAALIQSPKYQNAKSEEKERLLHSIGEKPRERSVDLSNI